MNKYYISDIDEPSNEELGIKPLWSFPNLLCLIVVIAAALVAIALLIPEAKAEAKIGATNRNTEGFRSSTRVFADCPATDWSTLQTCITRLKNQARTDGATRTSGRNYYHVRIVFPVDFVPATPTCAAPPAPRLQTCPTGFTGAGWQQQPQQAAYPSCAITWSPLTAPAGVCTQIPSNSATLKWDPPTQNTDGSPLTNLQSYVIHYGTSRESLTRSVALFVPNATTYRIEGLTTGTWYFAIKAVAATGAESSLSPIASKVIS